MLLHDLLVLGVSETVFLHPRVLSQRYRGDDIEIFEK